jgi:DNA invertase Pin-like site-specific DNA recombinase
MTIFGYARVSTDGPWRPRMRRCGAGCAKVYSETASGAKTDRATLRKAVALLEEGDVLMVTRLDRLARSTGDLLNPLDEISKRSLHGLSDSGQQDLNACTFPFPRRMATQLTAILALTAIGTRHDDERCPLRVHGPYSIVRIVCRPAGGPGFRDEISPVRDVPPWNQSALP